MLQNKVILVTGALGRAGSSAVKMFLDRGAIVVGCDIRPLEERPDLMELTQTYGKSRFLFVRADVTEEQQVQDMMDTIDRTYGRLDGSFHNTYVNVWKPTLDLSLEEWDRTLNGSLTSTFLINKSVLPLMIRSGGGSIVNTSSVLGQIPKKGCVAYGAAKAGVNQLTRVIAAEYASSGIRANVIAPGDFKSTEQLANMSERAKEIMREAAYLGRSGDADEVTEVAAFLLSDAASYVTASIYTVDGGFRG